MAKELVYLAQTKLPNGEWGTWVCNTFEEAERAILDKRATLTDSQDQKAEFRIVKHETLESDSTGEIAVSNCPLGHKFAHLSSHPKNGNVYYCPRCLVGTLELAKGEAARSRTAAQEAKKILDETQQKLGRLTEVLCSFARLADTTSAAAAFAALEKYEKDYIKNE
jgi:hypothetical protein